MDMDFKEFMELARKATLYDGIINYLKSNKYFSREDILYFVGESEPAENASEDISEGGI